MAYAVLRLWSVALAGSALMPGGGAPVVDMFSALALNQSMRCWDDLFTVDTE